MILFSENGRLGNQIFQYCGLRHYARKGEKLCLFGFKDFQSLLTGFDAEIINSNAKKYKRSYYYRIYKYANFLSENEITPVIFENKDREIVLTTSKFDRIKIAKNVFFQSEKFLNQKITKKLKVRRKILKRAEEIIRNIKCENKRLIFVQVRRGDHLRWPSRENPATLSISYFRQAIEIIKSKMSNVFLIITSDDTRYVNQEFEDIRDKYISMHSNVEDFALMTLCEGGILSASTFAWWASYFINRKNPESILIAPKFWIGHRKNEWYPKNSETSFLTYINTKQ